MSNEPGAEEPIQLRVVVVNFNAGPWLSRCVEALLDSDHGAQICVVDNASTDTSLDGLEDLPVKVIRNRTNRGYAVACNQGAALSPARHLAFVNPDCVVKARYPPPRV